MHQVFILEDSSVISIHLQENILDVFICPFLEILIAYLGS